MTLHRLWICVVLASLGGLALAQPDVTWERVGDLPHDASRLPYSAGPNGFLWAGFEEAIAVDGQLAFFQGLYRLPAPYDSSSIWEKVSPPPSGLIARGAYVIGHDTLLLDVSVATLRSIDGGATWEPVSESVEDFEVILEVPADLPHAGRLIGAHGSEMTSFSDDRGATWTRAPQDPPFNDPPTIADSAAADRIALVTTGPHAGRLVAGGLSGLTTSDDGGYTWQATSEYVFFEQRTNCLATLHGQAPGGGDRVVTVMNDPRIPDDSIRVIVSDDGGETWQRKQGLDPGDFRTCVEVVDLGDGRAVAVMMSGPLWWTEDAGETWVRWAEWEELAPPTEVINGNARARWAIVAPDGRLIVGITSNGSDTSIYDKRSSEPVAAWAVNAEPDIETSRSSLRVYPNPSRQLMTLEYSETATHSQADVVVVDAQGRAVSRHQLASGSSWQLDVSAWAPGVYYATIAGGQSSAVAFTVVR